MSNTVEIIMRFIDQASAGIRASMGNINNSFGMIGGAVQKTAGLFTGAMGKIGGFFKGIVDQARWASLIFGSQLVGAIQNVVTEAAKFERFRMAAIALTGSAKSADQMAASVRKLARESMFGVDQIAELETRLIGNTKSVKVSERALRSMIVAVTATGGGYSELESSVRAWIQTNSKAKASSEELNRQFANANIPMLRLLAEDIERNANHPLRKYIETAQSAGGASASLTKQFQSQSGKLPELQKGLDATNKRLEELKASGKEGTSTFLNAEKSMMSYQRQISEANKTIGNYEAAQKSATVATKTTKLTVDEILAQMQNLGDLGIPGREMGEAMMVAIENSKEFQEVMKEIEGTVSFQLEKLADNAKLAAFSFIGLDESFKVVEGSVMSMLGPALTQLNDYLEDNEQKIIDLGKSLSGNMPMLMAFGAFVAGILLPAIVTLIAPLVIMGTVFGSIGYAVGIVIEKMGGMESAFNKIKDAIDKSSTAVYEFITGTKSPIPVSWRDVGGILDREVVQPFKKKLEELKNDFVFGDEKSPIPASNIEVLQKFGDILERIGRFVKDIFKPVINELGVAFKELEPAIGPISQLLFGVIAVLGAVAYGIVRAFTTALAFIIIMLKGISQIIVGFFTLIKGIVTLDGVAIVEGFKLIGEGIINTIGGAIGTIIGLIAGFVKGIIDFFYALYMALVGGSIVPDMVNAIIMWFTNLFTTVFAALVTFVENTIKKVTEMAKNVLETIENFVTSFITFIKNLYTTGVDLFNRLKDALKSKAFELKDAVISAIKSMVSGVGDMIGGMVGRAYGWGKKLIGDFIDGIKNALRALGDNSKVIAEKMGFGGLFAHGGIVPGPIGAPVPIVAHGGERIIPRTGVDEMGGGGGVTINFYGGVSMDSEERVNELAERISDILGRQNELARYGVSI